MELSVQCQSDRFNDFLSQLPFGGFSSAGMLLHYGRNSVKAFCVDGKKLVVKNFKQPNSLNRFIYGKVRGSKAERAYRNAHKLRSMGINTPHAVGYVETRESGLLDSSFLVTEYTDYCPITDIFKEDALGQLPLFDAFVRFTVELHEKGILHRDYNLGNVLFKRRDDGTYDFMLIDVNRMSFVKMSKRKCLSSIKRMCTNPDILYYMSKKYAEIRGWNKYICFAELALQRDIFEKKRHRRLQLKGWIKSKR